MLDPKEDFYPEKDYDNVTTCLNDKFYKRYARYNSFPIVKPTSKGINSYKDLVDQIKPFMKLVANELEMPEYSN